MITKIEIENFKAFGARVVLELGSMNILSGLNSSGKSSAYQCLFLLMQSRESKVKIGKYFYPSLKINGQYLTIGTKEELLNDPLKKEVHFSFTWKDQEELKLTYQYLEKNTDMNIEIKEFVLTKFESTYDQESKIKAVLNTESLTWDVEASRLLGFDNSTFGSILEYYLREMSKNTKDESLYSSTVKFSNVTNVEFSGIGIKSLDIQFNEFAECVHSDFRNVSIPDVKGLFEQMALGGKREATYLRLRNNAGEGRLNKFFDEGIIEIPPFRGIPQRIYNETNNPNPLHGYVSKKHTTVSYYYDLKLSKMVTGTLEEAFNFWISKKFNLADEVIVKEVLADYSTEILLKIKNKMIPINNMGFGVSQILPVIFTSLVEGNDRLIIVDEPEIHLHPSAQAKLADFFFQMALVGRKLFIETHSETLLNRLILNIIKHPEVKSKIKMTWITREEGSSYPQEIIFDEMGYLMNPPKGFLDEGADLNEEFSNIRMNLLSHK